MPTLNLTPDELLTTTRAVRRRLDLDRPVERGVIEECIRIAQQAPNGSNRQEWHFVVVTDGGKRTALGRLYKMGAESYFRAAARESGVEGRDEGRRRLLASASYLVEHIQEVPVHVIPCISGRTEGEAVVAQASRWGSIIPAAWSFMLALRARGLGSALTTFHLSHEEEAARLLGIPFELVTQAGLIPVAYTRGTEFGPAPRGPLAQMLHWDGW